MSEKREASMAELTAGDIQAKKLRLDAPSPNQGSEDMSSRTPDLKEEGNEGEEVNLFSDPPVHEEGNNDEDQTAGNDNEELHLSCDPPDQKEGSDDEELNVFCDLCQHHSKTSAATFSCNDCPNMYLCTTCMEKHKVNKATCHHIMVPVTPISKDSSQNRCPTHCTWPLVSFCQDCERLVCNICVSTDHENHNVQGLGDLMKEMSTTVDKREKEIKMLQNEQKELTWMKKRGEEDINRMIREIETRKQQGVKNNQKIQDDFERVTEKVEKLSAITKEAREIISMTEPTDLNKLPDLKRKLEQITSGDSFLDPRHGPISVNRNQAHILPYSYSLKSSHTYLGPSGMWNSNSYNVADLYNL